tara:strand:+ start:7546 stop:8493 length:948 start_codon:yes stop_codon:yes gene_type:complete
VDFGEEIHVTRAEFFDRHRVWLEVDVEEETRERGGFPLSATFSLAPRFPRRNWPIIFGVIIGSLRLRVFYLRGEGEVGVNPNVEIVGGAVFSGEEGGEGDHSCVVGGEGGGSELDFHAGVFGGSGEGFLKGAIAGDSSGKSDEGVAIFFGGVDGFFDEGIDDGGLKGGANISEVGLGIFDFLELIEDSCFESGEGEVEGSVFENRPREGIRFRVAPAGVLFNFWSARVGELEHAADFVEGFAGGVVDSATDEAVLPVGLDLDEESVAAGDDETEVGRDVASLQEGREKMPFHVVDSEEGFVGGGGESFGVGETDE